MNTPVVLITAALHGIGRATALAFARAGYRMIISGRHNDLGQTLATELRALGTEAVYVNADVRYEEEVRHLVDQAVAHFGRLDIAINNAATEGLMGLVIEQTTESYAATFDTNVLGVLLCMKHELRVMLPQHAGSIINLSSDVGKVGAAGASIYAASKHAVEGLTKSAALEVADSGVRINIVAPGPTETAMLNRFTGDEQTKARLIAEVPLKRIGTPEEVAEAIVFVASEKASFMIGATVAVDGGKVL